MAPGRRRRARRGKKKRTTSTRNRSSLREDTSILASSSPRREMNVPREHPDADAWSEKDVADALPRFSPDVARERRSAIRRKRAALMLEKRRRTILSRSDHVDGMRAFVNRALPSFSRSDLDPLAVAEDEGPEATETYLRTHCGRNLRMAWPPGWHLIITDILADPQFGRSDLRCWGREYLCCRTRLRFVGRARDMSSGNAELRCGDPVILLGQNGRVFCYCGPPDDAVYLVADNIREFADVGLRRVDPVYGSAAAEAPTVTREAYLPLIRAWSRDGLAGVAREVTRMHGQVLRITCPVGCCFRICALKCLENGGKYGIMLRDASRALGVQIIPLGCAYPPDGTELEIRQRSYSPLTSSDDDDYDFFYDGLREGAAHRRATSLDLLDRRKERVPVILTENGDVMACDAEQKRYIRLGYNIAQFASSGMRRYFEGTRFCKTGGDARHDRKTECPLGPA